MRNSLSERTYAEGELERDAAVLPRNVIEGMNQRDGANEGGLTLSREHIVTLNQYVRYVTGLPTDLPSLVPWLGYTEISEPVLSVDAMRATFLNLHSHAREWGSLSDECKKLSSELGARARTINTTGEGVLQECERTKALGKAREKWQLVEFETPVELNAADKGIVRDLVDYMEVIKDDVDLFYGRVTSVRQTTEAFRDKARFDLLSEVNIKTDAITRHQNGAAVQALREELAAFDKDIEALNKQYDEYVKMAVSGLAAGPLGAVITGSIYGSKAEKIRKERNRLQKERKACSARLSAAVNLEGRLQILRTNMDELTSRLEEVVTASSHLQTAWQTIGTYIEVSIEKLEKMNDSRQLGIFIIHFKNFLSQWDVIERCSISMTRVFDDSLWT
ncbi:alpha-xenorhabdolysin family binary toxin subunit A [Pseudomonas sp. MAFF212428]|uniref:Alpha-xenorhabdolysin family binary toxin subunit A n=1 Tax=Pseudomonas brassicae TaxID=2708063 RepID=A0A6B3NXI6_9PSED|nr:alpha-xenorhabdolysin family binary toxin subunit A [Pseudomonas brassicae]NER59667.1 alpha-xenorhabdolysin family binary toxin subunit A [Pseudomonas brassicae]NER65851.1 alpha-xenorhabdolysin family binary toxin subunit A [Pseudomonas brassicae]